MNGHRRVRAFRDAASAPIVAAAATVLVVGVMLAIGSGAPDSNLSASADREAQLVVNESGPATTVAPDDHDHGTGDLAQDGAHEHATGEASGDADEVHVHASEGAAASDTHAHDSETPDGHHDNTGSSPSPTDGHTHDAAGATSTSLPAGDHGHEHPAPAPAPAPAPGSTTPPTVGHQHPPTGSIVTIDDPRLTIQQQTAARSLLDGTMYGMRRFPTVDAVTAAGYEWIGDGNQAGFRHYVNWSYLADGEELDPSRIESVVAEVKPGGALEVSSAMYILEEGTTMSDVPDLAGELTTWHNHTNLCWVGHRLAGTLIGGVCRPGGELRVTPPMLHVWLKPQPCGPFSGIEGHGGDCSHSH